MATLLRRLFWLALIGGGAFAVWSWWQRERDTSAAPAPEWPPMDPPTQPAPAAEVHESRGSAPPPLPNAAPPPLPPQPTETEELDASPTTVTLVAPVIAALHGVATLVSGAAMLQAAARVDTCSPDVNSTM